MIMKIGITDSRKKEGKKEKKRSVSIKKCGCWLDGGNVVGRVTSGVSGRRGLLG